MTLWALALRPGLAPQLAATPLPKVLRGLTVLTSLALALAFTQPDTALAKATRTRAKPMTCGDKMQLWRARPAAFVRGGRRRRG